MSYKMSLIFQTPTLNLILCEFIYLTKDWHTAFFKLISPKYKSHYTFGAMAMFKI